jgi:hypothetical protein
MNKPERALTLTLAIQGDTLEEIESALYHILFEARMGEYTKQTISGGVGWGGWWEWKTKEITHEQYVAELNDYLMKEKSTELP